MKISYVFMSSHSQLIKERLRVAKFGFAFQGGLTLSVIGIHGRKLTLLHAKRSKIPFVQFDMVSHTYIRFVERRKFLLSVSLLALKENAESCV